VEEARNRNLIFCLALILTGSSVISHAQGDQRQLAISYERQGKTEDAKTIWKTISSQQPSDPEPFAHLGLLEAREEHYSDAIHFYRKAMSLAPEMPGLRLNLGLSLFKNGDYQQAIQIFDPLIKAQPDDQRLDVLVGMSHYGLAEYKEASSFLKRAAEQDSGNLTLLLTLAHSCLLSNQYQCVLDSFHSIVSLNAESAEADMLVGEALDEMKDSEGAIREFRAAVKSNPKQPNAHFGLGYLLWTKGQYADAAREFQTEIDNDPQHPHAMLYLADSDIQDAVTEFKVAIRLSPNDVNAHWRLGRLYRSMKLTALAKAEFDKANSLNQQEDQRLLKVMSTIPDGDRKPISSPATPTNK
jgi:tetratricopeptide (TPR) repeat protein